jgi:osmotically-inducible protein OsmY
VLDHVRKREGIAMMRTDLNLQVAVSAALRAALGAGATEIAVSAEDGIVRLSGAVRTPEEKLEAEHTVQRVGGVHAVVESLRVVTDGAGAVTDQALAQHAVQALATGAYPIGRDVTIRVENGWLMLGGTVASAAEYTAVERALECLAGARGMRSEVRIAGASVGGASCRVAPSAM